MTSTVFHVALLIWSGLFIIAGALLMVASQLGHLAEAVTAAGRADRPKLAPIGRRADRAERRASARQLARMGSR